MIFIKAGRAIRDMALAATDRTFEAALRVDRITPTVMQGLAQRAQRVERDGLLLRLTVDSEERLPEITRWLVSEGVGLYHLAARRPSLGTVFVELMQGEQVGEPDTGGRPVGPSASDNPGPRT